MTHSVASDLVLHCLLMSHKKDARLKWVKNTQTSITSQPFPAGLEAVVTNDQCFTGDLFWVLGGPLYICVIRKLKSCL